MTLKNWGHGLRPTPPQTTKGIVKLFLITGVLNTEIIIIEERYFKWIWKINQKDKFFRKHKNYSSSATAVTLKGTTGLRRQFKTFSKSDTELKPG